MDKPDVETTDNEFDAAIVPRARAGFRASRFGRLRITAYGHANAWDDLESKFRNMLWNDYLAGFREGWRDTIIAELEAAAEWD